MSVPRPRLHWIDALRGVAVLTMIWVHVANTFLLRAHQGTPLYAELTFYHGLVAPCFFWVAGLMRGFAAQRQIESGNRKPWALTARRLLLIAFIGHLMHVPWSAFRVGMDHAAWRTLLQVDVLQCLAYSCLALLVLERWCETQRALIIGAAVLGVVVVASTDALRGASVGLLPVDLMLSREAGSMFPLFPWAGFAIAGFLQALWRPAWLPWLIIAVVSALVLPPIPKLPDTPIFFLQRLGWVQLLALALQALGTHCTFPAWLLLAGRQSLFLYVAHLMMIHAVPLFSGRAADQAIGATLEWSTAGVVWLGLALLNLALAWGWEHWNTRASRS